MAAAGSGTGMPLVLGAFVFQGAGFGLQHGEALADQIGRAHAGNTFLNGLTLTPAYTPAATKGSALAQAWASASESNSATIRLPEKPAAPGSLLSIWGNGPASSRRPACCRACRRSRWADRAASR